MMIRMRWTSAVGVLLVGLTAGCTDELSPVTPDMGPSLTTAESGGGPGGVIGSGRGESSTITTFADSTARGPGGVIGSGH